MTPEEIADDVVELNCLSDADDDVGTFNINGLLGSIAAATRTERERAEKAEAERDEAQREHTDMMWQRRRADERAEKAEAEVARLREALQGVVSTASNIDMTDQQTIRAMVHVARAALTTEPKP